MSQSTREFLWFQRLVKNIVSILNIEIQESIQIKSKIFENNNGALVLMVKTGDMSRIKHIHTKYWFFKEYIGKNKNIVLRKIDTLDQIINIFTKRVEKK